MRSQSQIVLDLLAEKGEVGRNECIREHFITRLGAIICDLKDKGYEFTTERRGNTDERQGDFIYILVKDPRKFDEQVYKTEVIEQRESEYRNPKLF